MHDESHVDGGGPVLRSSCTGILWRVKSTQRGRTSRDSRDGDEIDSAAPKLEFLELESLKFSISKFVPMMAPSLLGEHADNIGCL